MGQCQCDPRGFPNVIIKSSIPGLIIQIKKQGYGKELREKVLVFGKKVSTTGKNGKQMISGKVLAEIRETVYDTFSDEKFDEFFEKEIKKREDGIEKSKEKRNGEELSDYSREFNKLEEGRKIIEGIFFDCFPQNDDDGGFPEVSVDKFAEVFWTAVDESQHRYFTHLNLKYNS